MKSKKLKVKDNKQDMRGVTDTFIRECTTVMKGVLKNYKKKLKVKDTTPAYKEVSSITEGNNNEQTLKITWEKM